MQTASLHDILSHHRPADIGPAVLSDFTLDVGQEVPAETVLTDAAWSLYGLDLDAGQAIFVRLAPGTDLSQAAFLPILQHAAARQVLTLPLSALPALSLALPSPDKLILIFSMGRSGTTLVSSLLGQVPGVCSLSEPDPFATLAMARFKMPQADQQALLAAVTRFSFRPLPGRNMTTLALKFQSQVLFQAELFHRAFPKAINLFLYRDAESWGNSLSHFMQMVGLPVQLDPEAARYCWMMGAAATPWERLGETADLSAPSFDHVELTTPQWALHIMEYQRLAAGGMPFMALHYSDLNGQRAASTARLLAHCGLPADALDRALTAFDRDSQEGTQVSRDHPVVSFSGKDRARLRQILARLPGTLSPDVVLKDSPAR